MQYNDHKLISSKTCTWDWNVTFFFLHIVGFTESQWSGISIHVTVCTMLSCIFCVKNEFSGQLYVTGDTGSKPLISSCIDC